MIVSFHHNKDNNTIEVVYREPSNRMYLVYPSRPVPDRVFKETYSVSNGKIILLKRVEGVHKPSELIEETITFPND